MSRPTPTLRGFVVTATTLVGIGAVLALNPTTQSALGAASTTTSTGTSTTGSSTTGSSSGSDSSGSDSSSSSSASPSASASSGSTSGSTSSAATTYTGQTYESPYGPMQVQVSVSGGTITDIQWVQLPSDGHSQQINSYAAPQLVQEALSGQSATVDTVSGASYTSEGFRQSLQSALSQAGM